MLLNGVKIVKSDHTSEPWLVGVLFSQTGFTSVSEQAQLRGTLIAIEEINQNGGVNGRPIQPVVYDPGSDAKAYGQYAKKLMVEDGATTIFGCYTSDCRKAVLPVVERLNGLLWYPTPYEGIEFSPNVICTGLMSAPSGRSSDLPRRGRSL
ncbi:MULTISPECIES: transporter substrate-binding protein [unclassified Mesorhizobium]|uniref:transporter substrate-binding protein n=1 Tax=unclassified Mesorhizobium TaxID=325217 RepID=UPI002982388C|nr:MULTISPECIES: transporter substrate-binding protein [unclassified Mesorhizobium]